MSRRRRLYAVNAAHHVLSVHCFEGAHGCVRGLVIGHCWKKPEVSEARDPSRSLQGSPQGMQDVRMNGAPSGAPSRTPACGREGRRDGGE